MDWQNIVIVILLALGVLTVVGGLAVLRARYVVSLFQPLKSRFGMRHPEAAEDRPVLTDVVGSWDGAPVRVRYEMTPWYEASRVVYTIGHRVPLTGEVSFRRHRRLHRLARRIGLIPDPGAVDRDFNRVTYPEAEHDADIEPLIAEPGVRESILRLLRHRGARVTLHPDSVSASFATRRFLPGPSARSRARPEFAMDVLGGLQDLAHAASGRRRARRADHPAQAAEEVEEPLFDEEMASLVSVLAAQPMGNVLLIGPAMLFVGPAMLVWSLEFSPVTWQLHIIGLLAGLLLLSIQAFLAYQILRGRSLALRHFSLLVASAAVGFLCLGPGVVVSANGAFDQGPPAAEPARIERKLIADHYLLVRLEERPSRLLWIAATSNRLRGIGVGETIDVLVAPGALGHPWLVEAAPEAGG